MEWLTAIFSIKKIPTKFVFLFWISSGCLLFLPERALIFLKLTEFISSYGKFIGIIFLLTTTFLIIVLIIWISSKIGNGIRKKRNKKISIDKLNYLDSYEKAVIREFFILGKNTTLMPIDNPTVIGLINSHIIKVVSRNGKLILGGYYFSVSLENHLEPLLTDEVIGLPAREDEGGYYKLMQERPEWAKKLNNFPKYLD